MANLVSTDYNPIELPGIPELHFYRTAEACLDYRVSSITVVVGDHVSATCCNHWRFFVTFDSKESVCLDMVIADGSKDRKGYCGAVRKHYDVTSHFFKCIDMILRSQPFTFRDLVVTLKDAGCFRYKYPSHNDGCRFWVGQAIAALERAQLLVPPSAKAVQAEINYTWTSQTTKQPVPAAHGSFY
ncbi:hypothetical protein GSI_13022 [Ganoderma sinense ZZ0214-1]|uniref:DUF7770 domain-containing protein n=1 Tax=Ganoderma sinense ZZ0214-1 TaxID=1077348 RepID=A0A2G8RUF1_9APHY|nr:hypothetical protein GSI_13022 [Ganoderma sinense ZZ0214-1]